jgi:hypothetical protein
LPQHSRLIRRGCGWLRATLPPCEKNKQPSQDQQTNGDQNNCGQLLPTTCAIRAEMRRAKFRVVVSIVALQGLRQQMPRSVQPAGRSKGRLTMSRGPTLAQGGRGLNERREWPRARLRAPVVLPPTLSSRCCCGSVKMPLRRLSLILCIRAFTGLNRFRKVVSFSCLRRLFPASCCRSR